MTKKEWEKRLLKNLKSLSKQERKEVLEYYREMYDDKLDTGFSEREILKEFGSPEECARKILAENGNEDTPRQVSPPRERVKKPKRSKRWVKPLVIVTVVLSVCFLFLSIPGFMNNQIEEKTYQESEENVIEELRIDYSNVTISVYSDDSVSALSVTYPQTQTVNGKNTSRITVSDHEGVLDIKEYPIWIYNLGWGRWKTPEIVVHLPIDRTYSLDLAIDNGSITLIGDMYNVKKLTLSTANGNIDTRNAQISCETTINVEVNNGKIQLGSLSAQSLNASTDNGEISVTDGTVSEVAYLETDNGKISINGHFIAEQLIATTDNGEINASNGLIDVQIIKLEVDNGRIVANLSGKKSDYTFEVENSIGTTNITTQAGGTRFLSVEVDIGDITILFKEE